MAGSIRVTLSDDRTRAVVALDGEQTVSASMDLQTLGELVDVLALTAARMREGEPAPQLAGVNVRPVRGPWYVQGLPSNDAALLSFFHPGFGPVGFHLTFPEARAIGELLQRLAHQGSQVDAVVESLGGGQKA